MGLEPGSLINYFSANYSWGGNSSGSGTDNNGNLTLQQHWVPTDNANIYSYTQDYYYYDSLNRLSSTSEIHATQSGQSGGQDYAQVYDYDRWGNRTINQGSTSTNIPHPNYTVDSNTNRLIAPSGYAFGYDAAGNQTNDTYTGEGTRTYDPENHVKQVWANNQWQTYTYDADGRRIKRIVNGNETWQVYGMGGELLGEYESGAAPFLPTKEYGYRGGELLVTMASGDDARLGRFVTNLYYGALQRDPTSSELQNGVNALAAAGAQSYSQLLTAASSMARGLFTQTGYETSPYRSDAQYVADLYYTYLQRGPDYSGLGWWTAQVASPSGGRTNVCNAFEASTEFQTLVSTLYGTATSDNQRTEQLVNNFYLAGYGRNATSTELETQRDALNAAAAQGLSQVQAQVETMGRALFAAQVSDRSSNQQFVTNLYEAFLQRGPDALGLDFWTTSITAGNNSRQSVLDQFATCGPARELAGTLYREEYWLVSDRLGTPRMIVDKSGSLARVRRHDYLPFGEEIYGGAPSSPGVGGRTTTQGYMSDSTRQHFTGYETDAETGLNFAEARYQSTVQGRFTSVDPLPASAIADPQSLNRYSYVQNKPTGAIDPTGMALSDIGVYQTDNPASARYEEKNATWHTLRSASRLGFSRTLASRWARSSAAVAAARLSGAAAPYPPGRHDEIIREALQGVRGIEEVDILEAQAGSREVDYGEGYNTLRVDQAPLHSMVPDFWVEGYEKTMSHDAALAAATKEAKEAQGAFVSQHLQWAFDEIQKSYNAGDSVLRSGYRNKAFFYFGMAMHPLMDAHSPTHQWQVYSLTGEPITDGYAMLKHAHGESGPIPKATMAVMAGQIQLTYLLIFHGGKRPR